MNNYPIFRHQKLYSICNKEQFFTNGSISQYNKLFQINENESGQVTVKDLALIIYICSTQSYEYILEKLMENLEW